MSRRLGIYCWLRNEADPDCSLFIPVPHEDVGKTERTGLETQLIQISAGFLGVISGSVENDESPAGAVYREAAEEQSLVLKPDSVTNSLPTITVSRSKNGRLSSFDVMGHQVFLSPEQITSLQTRIPVQFVKHGALDRFLIENRHRLRPHVYLAGCLLLNRRLLY